MASDSSEVLGTLPASEGRRGAREGAGESAPIHSPARTLTYACRTCAPRGQHPRPPQPYSDHPIPSPLPSSVPASSLPSAARFPLRKHDFPPPSQAPAASPHPGSNTPLLASWRYPGFNPEAQGLVRARRFRSARLDGLGRREPEGEGQAQTAFPALLFRLWLLRPR